MFFVKPRITRYHLRARNARSSTAGQAVLSLVLLVGGIVVFVSVTLAFIALSFINATTGFEKANRALAAASGGVADALVQIVRNKDFVSLSPYVVPLGIYSAGVTVTPGVPVAGQATIVSGASVGFYTRRVRAVVSVVSSTGEVQLFSWNELPL